MLDAAVPVSAQPQSASLVLKLTRTTVWPPSIPIVTSMKRGRVTKASLR